MQRGKFRLLLISPFFFRGKADVLKHAGLKTITPACEDSVYLGEDFENKTNDYCVEKCNTNGGQLDVNDAECRWNPAIFDFQGHTVVEDPDCFSKYTVGYPDQSSYGATIDGVSPAQCQTACQKDANCVAWEWFVKADAEYLWSCVLKTQEDLMTYLNVSEPSPRPGNCPTDVLERCDAGALDCLKCDNWIKCYYQLDQTYSGRKFCAQGHGFCTPPQPKPNCADATYVQDTSQNNSYCVQKCTENNGSLDGIPECQLNPPNFDDNGHVLPDNLGCYSSWVYGMAPLSLDEVTLDLSPAECQNACQESPNCISWTWEVLVTGERRCAVYALDRLQAVVSTPVVEGGVFDEEICDSNAYAGILSGSVEDMQCHGLDTCVYKNAEAIYSGWKWCAQDFNPCDLFPIDPSPAPSCLDAIYLGTDMTKTNRWCVDRCDANGGTFPDGETECMLHPVVYDETTGETVFGENDCFLNLTYGTHGTDSSHAIEIVTGLTPAQCQNYCQDRLPCVYWTWEMTVDETAVCTLVTEGELQAVLAFDMATTDDSVCPSAMEEQCNAQTRNCLSCTDVLKCAFELERAYTGWKYCAFPRDPCSGQKDEGEDTACGANVSLDIGFVQDLTASASAYKDSWATTLAQTVTYISNRYTGIQWGYAGYRDKFVEAPECPSSTLGQQCYLALQVLSPTTNTCTGPDGANPTNDCNTWINDFADQSILDSCELDPKEAVYDAVYYAANRNYGLGWRDPQDNSVVRVLVITGDAEPHEDTDLIQGTVDPINENPLDGTIYCGSDVQYVSNSAALAVLRDQNVYPVIVLSNANEGTTRDTWTNILTQWGYNPEWVVDLIDESSVQNAVEQVIRETHCNLK